MIRLLLVTPYRDPLLELASAMEKDDGVELTWTDSGQKALDTLSETSVDLVVTNKELGDMTGLEFVEKLLRVNPMINSAVLSSLPSDEFHEASEGLGIFSQLPLRPAKEDAEKLLRGLKKLKDLTAEINIGNK